MSLARQMLELDLAWISRSSNGQLRFVPANDQEAGVNKCQWPGRQVLELDWDLDLSTNGWQMSMARGAGGLDLAQVLAHAWEPHAPPPFYSDLSLYPLSSPLWLFWIRDWIERGGVFKPRNQSVPACLALHFDMICTWLKKAKVLIIRRYDWVLGSLQPSWLHSERWTAEICSIAHS